MLGSSLQPKSLGREWTASATVDSMAVYFQEVYTAPRRKVLANPCRWCFDHAYGADLSPTHELLLLL